MDESGARLVHGGIERFSDLEAVSCHHWNLRAAFRRIQGARLRNLPDRRFGNRGTGHQHLKIGRGPLSAETSPNRAHGAVAKSASEISDVVQETDHSVF
jgi:hypothetical protein